MSKNKTTDSISVCQETVETFFDGIKQSVPKYHQSVTNVQQEYLQMVQNVLRATMTLQQDYAKKTGLAPIISESILKIVHDTTEELVRVAFLQNQITLATIDAAQQNIRTFSDNTKSFTDLNQNILQSWISVFPKTN